MEEREVFKIIKSKKLSGKIVQQFLNMLVRGELKPGDKLPSEVEMCDMFDVSRGTLREALKTLENMNLITIRQGVGAYINKLGISYFLKQVMPVILLGRNEIIDLMEVRKILEVYAAGAAAINAEESHKKLLMEELDAMKHTLHDFDRFIEHDINFHIHISKASKNVVLPKIIEAIRLLYIKQQKEVVRKPGAAQRALNFHMKIFKAIDSGNIEEAKKSMFEHLEDIERGIIDSEYLDSRTIGEENTIGENNSQKS